MQESLFHNGLVVKSPLLESESAVAYSVGWDASVKQTQKRNRLLMRVCGFHTPHIQFGSTYYNSAFLVQGFNPVKTIVITYNQTNGVINYRNRKFERNELLLLTRDEELDLLISDENTTFTIAIDENYFHEVFWSHYGIDFETRLKKRILLDPGKEQDFIGFLHFWINFFLTYEAANLLPKDYENIEEEIISTLFDFIILDNHPIKNENTILKNARNLIDQSLKLDLKLSEVSKHLGISQRALEYTFKRNLGMTPKNYMQILRLHAIHDELKHASPQTKISDTALKYAFFHMGHFSSEYKKLFGELPTETLKTNFK